MTSTILSLLTGEAIEHYTRRGYWRQDTFYSIAAAHAAAVPDRIAVRDRDRTLSWRQLLAAADDLALDLNLRGVRPGQRITFWMPDRIESIIIVLASSCNGLVSCPSPHRNHTVAEVTEMVQRMQAAAVVVQSGLGADASAHDVARAFGELPHVRHVYQLPPVSTSDAAHTPFAGHLLAGREPTTQPLPARDPNRVSYLAFTSGSTAKPKAVMHSDNTLLVTAHNLCRDWSIGPTSVITSMSPFSHNLGIGALLTWLVAGGQYVIHDLARRESLVDRLTSFGVTYLIGVPTHATDLVTEMRRRGITGLPAIRGFRLSGAASAPQLKRELLDLGIPVQSGYGMTENNSHQYTHPGDPAELILGSCGRATDGYEIRIFDPADRDRELPTGEIGLVAGRGACLMLGYFDDQNATEASFNAGGWFMTGDVGRLDAGGYLRLEGRAKELIIRGGHNINPSRIEELAAGCPGIARAAVVPVPDDRLGERICIAISCKPGNSVSPDALLDHLAHAGLSRYEMPELWLDIDDMPLMANGKIQKADIVAWIRDGRLTPRAIGRS